MKAILIAVAVVVLMAIIGWLSFGMSSERATVNVELNEIREDTAGAVEATEDIAEKAAEGVRELAREADERVEVEIHSEPVDSNDTGDSTR